MSEVKTRLKEFITYLSISEADFEMATGISNGYVSNIRNSIGPTNLPKILKKYPHLNRNWLLFGEGEMLNLAEPPKMDGGINPVPVYDVQFSLGTAMSILEARGTYYPVAWLSTPEVAGCDVIVRARGDSMADKINDKDWIGIKRINNFKTDGFIPGLIYAIVTSEQEIVKYVFKGRDDKHVLIKSHNPFYEDFEKKISEIMELWQVRVVIPVSKIQTF